MAGADSQRYLVTSDAFKAAARACGGNPDASYFASIYKAASSDGADAVINGQPINIGSGKYDAACTGSDDDSFAYSASLSDSRKMLETALQAAH